MGKRFGYLLSGVLISSGAAALDASGQRYVNQLVQGGPVSIREAAQSIYHTGMKDPEVLDVAAEVLAQQYKTATGNTELDALAWVCKALGSSGNPRYTAIVKQAAEDGRHRKLDRHCSAAVEQLPENGGDSYRPGDVDLAKYRDNGAAPAAAARPKAASASSGTGSFDDVREGMSMDEVNGILGAPSATYSHQTGKAWIPFNFKGKDVARVVALYEGRGRIIFSQESVYSSVWRVMEIVKDPSESGYP